MPSVALSDLPGDIFEDLSWDLAGVFDADVFHVDDDFAGGGSGWGIVIIRGLGDVS